MVAGKSIIVTGAGSGIGATTAEKLAAAGARVIVADLDGRSAEAVAANIIGRGGTAKAVTVDVADEASVKAMVQTAIDVYGRLDGAHNNAGIEMVNKPVHEISLTEWSKVLAVDLTGVFLCIKHEFLAMKHTGGGSIVNTASAAGVRGQINAADYVAAKHGVVGLTKSAAVDGGALGIRVNAVCPGLIMTPMARDRLMQDPVFAQALDGLRQRHHIGRFGETEEVTNAVLWLLSDESSFVTGTPMLVDGGYAV